MLKTNSTLLANARTRSHSDAEHRRGNVDGQRRTQAPHPRPFSPWVRREPTPPHPRIKSRGLAAPQPLSPSGRGVGVRVVQAEGSCPLCISTRRAPTPRRRRAPIRHRCPGAGTLTLRARRPTSRCANSRANRSVGAELAIRNKHKGLQSFTLFSALIKSASSAMARWERRPLYDWAPIAPRTARPQPWTDRVQLNGHPGPLFSISRPSLSLIPRSEVADGSASAQDRPRPAPIVRRPVELIGGEIVRRPMTRARHARAQSQINRHLGTFDDGAGTRGWWI